MSLRSTEASKSAACTVVGVDDAAIDLHVGDLIRPKAGQQCIAQYFGATPQLVTEGGVTVCGSIGEVSNDPSEPETFDVESDEEGTGRDNQNNQKSVVWTQVALYGEDQLRQRMAWALAQIVTTVPGNINANTHTEIFTHYYDIFVKNAFGNYRDILGE